MAHVINFEWRFKKEWMNERNDSKSFRISWIKKIEQSELSQTAKCVRAYQMLSTKMKAPELPTSKNYDASAHRITEKTARQKDGERSYNLFLLVLCYCSIDCSWTEARLFTGTCKPWLAFLHSDLLADLLTLHTRVGSLMSAEQMLLTIPRYSFKHRGVCYFAVAPPNLWHKLLLHLFLKTILKDYFYSLTFKADFWSFFLFMLFSFLKFSCFYVILHFYLYSTSNPEHLLNKDVKLNCTHRSCHSYLYYYYIKCILYCLNTCQYILYIWL